MRNDWSGRVFDERGDCLALWYYFGQLKVWERWISKG